MTQAGWVTELVSLAQAVMQDIHEEEEARRMICMPRWPCTEVTLRPGARPPEDLASM